MMNSLEQDDFIIESILERVKDNAVACLAGIDNRSTSVLEARSDARTLPEQALGSMAILDLFHARYEQLMTASAGPRYFGYVTGGATPASIAGDWLVSVFDQNTQNVAGFGDVSARMEEETLGLLLELLELPTATFRGGFVAGATMSNFTCLAVARQWAGQEKGENIALDGLRSPNRVLAGNAHSSSLKALAMLGMGSRNIISLPCLPGREAIDTKMLAEWLETNQSEPAILISSGGTVNSVDFDDMQAIAALKKKYSFWWHIDAAFGAWAASLPEHKVLLAGWHLADSITVDNHKWLNVPYDSAVFFVREAHAGLQVETFQNANAPYLGDPLAEFSYLNFLPDNSRRFRALPTWFSLNAYGREGYRQLFRNSIEMAALFARLLESDPIFELTVPLRLNVVCFSFKDPAHLNRAKDLLAALAQSGRVFITPGMVLSKPCFRAAFVNWRTTAQDVQILHEELHLACDKIMA